MISVNPILHARLSRQSAAQVKFLSCMVSVSRKPAFLKSRIKSRTYLLLILPFLICWRLSAQQISYTLSGRVIDEDSISMSGVYVRDLGGGSVSLTDNTGYFEIKAAQKETRLEISFVGYRKDTVSVSAGMNFLIHRLTPEPGKIGEVVVSDRSALPGSLQRIPLRNFGILPSASGNIENFLPALGASLRNEMSSRYSVRGGSYDENLIYINDIEVYRPMLMKTGQQEGLSFINTAMISSIEFSSGGFETQYGDKMSSVLDIRYKTPSSDKGSISAGFLGASANAEGVAGGGRITYIAGIRYKSNSYLLSTLETKGEYKPDYFDMQSYVTYDIGNKAGLSFLGNLAFNRYNLVPESRSTSFGTMQQAMNFNVYYEGREADKFNTSLFALSLKLTPSANMLLKLTGSAFVSGEAMTSDILSYYNISVLDNTFGSGFRNDSILNLGYGGMHQHVRNYCDALISNIIFSGSFKIKDHNLKCGFTWQSENIDDRVKEWELLDSAGYSIPKTDDALELYRSVAGNNRLSSVRVTGYFQDALVIYHNRTKLYLNGGVRFNHWSVSGQFLVSPRFRLDIDPQWLKKFTWHAAAGWYFQPPFYKEMRDEAAVLHTGIKAQRSFHITGGTDYDFDLWQRPFRLTAELYFKKLDDLIPYYQEDIDIQYLPDRKAKGYTYGLELKMNGEFVKDAESWLSLSLMRAREDTYGDGYGYYRRPSDQLVNFGMFFQDYLPNNPSWKVHLNAFYGSRIPYNPPGNPDPSNSFTLNAYKRIDIGLSKSVFRDRYGNVKTGIYHLEDLSFSFEIFNLFNFSNEASYQWIRTVNNQEGVPNVFAVPDYLTGRLFNVKISAEF
jgi:hypothetical protein